MAKTEIEYKYKLKNADELVKFLDKTAKLKYVSRQVDTYYDSDATGYTKDLENGRRIDLWLRLREEGSRASVNFKDWSVGDNKGYCDEFESSIDAPADIKQIFERMGFTPATVVDKQRRAYEYKDTEIFVDRVKDLGDFIEIEYYGGGEDIAAAQKLLKNVLREIGAKVEPEEDHRGYPYHLIARKRAGKV
jgi:adenylate cyclase class 2